MQLSNGCAFDQVQLAKLCGYVNDKPVAGCNDASNYGTLMLQDITGNGIMNMVYRDDAKGYRGLPDEPGHPAGLPRCGEERFWPGNPVPLHHADR